MIYFIYPNKDTTLYKHRNLLELNSGFDEILEIKKVNTDTDGLVLSRVLLEFSNDLFTKNKNKLLNSEFYLNLKIANSSELSIEDSISIHPLKKSWDEGVGRYYDTESTNFSYKGASWRYSDVAKNFWKSDGTTKNYIGGGDYYEHSEIPYYINDTDDLKFIFKEAFSDIKVNITSIVKSWLLGDIKNNGLLLKFTEESIDAHSSIQFFSKDTNTIYYPHLEIRYDDYRFEPCEQVYMKSISCETNLCVDSMKEIEEGNLAQIDSGSIEQISLESGSIESGLLESSSLESSSLESSSLESSSLESSSLESSSLESSSLESASIVIDTDLVVDTNKQCTDENNITGTFGSPVEKILVKKSNITQLISEDFMPILKTIKKEYKQTERKKIRVGVRSKRPRKTFASKSQYSLENFVTHGIYYSVRDAETDEVLIDFSKYTKISCDSNGHYFNFDFGCLAVGRFYTFFLKTEIDEEIEIHADKRNFRIIS